MPEKISIVIPVRNEETNIKTCLDSLMNQTFKSFEIIVVDDISTDKTVEIIKEHQKHHNNIFLIELKSKPDDWSGKAYALQEGSKIAKYPYILFIDADVKLSPDCLEKAIKYLTENNLDVLSYAAFQECKSFFEYSIQPLVFYILNILYPIENNNKDVTACNGIFILVNKDFYNKIGSHKTIKTEVLEDVKFAQQVKASQGKLNFIYAPDLISVRMYKNLNDIIEGWTKNIFALLNYSFLKAITIILFLLILFWLPLILLFTINALKLWLISIIILVLIYFSYVYFKMKYSLWVGLLYPVGSLILTYIIINSIISYKIKGQVKWKGRTYKVK